MPGGHAGHRRVTRRLGASHHGVGQSPPRSSSHPKPTRWDRITLQNQKTGAYKATSAPDGKRRPDDETRLIVINIFNADGSARAAAHGRRRAGSDGVRVLCRGKTALSANHGDGSVSVIDLEKGQVVGSNSRLAHGIETLHVLLDGAHR